MASGKGPGTGGGAADSGQAANPGGWGLLGVFTGFADAIGKGADSGFGLGDGSGTVALPSLDGIAQGAADFIGGQYPGYGTLWTYDTTKGIQVTGEGWAAVALAAVGAWWVLK